MKKFIILFFILSVLNTLKAQNTAIQFYPSNPTPSDSVMVVTYFPGLSGHCNFGIVSHSFYIFDDRIDFYPEFCPEFLIQDSTFCVVNDTLYLEPLEVGKYNINVYVGITGQCPVGNNWMPLDTIYSTLRVDIPNSIIETQETDIKIFPNPSYGHFDIEIKSGESYFLRVSNLLAKELFTQEINDNRNKVLLNSFSKGLYFLEFESNKSKNRFVKKIILK